MQLGFVGTGTMGAPMVRCLLEAGHRVAVYDVRQEAVAALVERGAAAADGPAAASRGNDVVFTSLPGPAEVERVALDPNSGILAGLAPGAVYVDLTTNAPEVARRVAAQCRARQIDLLDAPVSGRPPQMTVMAGGDKAVFDKCRPLFEAMAGNIFHVGGNGAGCAAKLVTQYLGYTNFIAALEGMLIAAKAGLDLGVLAQIVPVSAGASRTFDNIPRAVFDGSYRSGGTLDIVAKDMLLACDLARSVAAPAHLGLLAHDVFHRAQAQGWGQEGFPTAARILEAMAGVELRAAASADQPTYQTVDPRRPRR